MKQYALNTGRDNRLLDHIAPLCSLLDIPLILTEEKNQELTKQYYPQTQVIYIPYEELNLFDLAVDTDLFIQGTFWDQEITSLFKSVYPHIKFAYCPHGNSDKGHQKPMMEAIVGHDLIFIYGDHMIERFKKQKLWEKIPPYIVTGNYRLAFYEKNRPFYDALAEKEVFSKLNKENRTILYAPTWNDEECSSSFYNCCSKLIAQLPSHFNLIVKIHPLLEEMDPALFYRSLPDETNRPNLLFIKECPLIYPILNRTDIYLGDVSSIGYDFLYFQKPMYFFNPFHTLPKDSPTLFLHQCGLQIPNSESEGLFHFIESKLSEFGDEKKQLQKKIYDFAFDKVHFSKESLK